MVYNKTHSWKFNVDFFGQNCMLEGIWFFWQKKRGVRTKMLTMCLVKIGVFIKFSKCRDVKIPIILRREAWNQGKSSCRYYSCMT